MADIENPRTFVRPRPIPLPSHRALKITARNSKIYTCEVPTRKQVAQDNYARRKHQMTKCGYRSVNYKPYQCIGDVVLNDKKLIMGALGQDNFAHTQLQESESSSSDYDSQDEMTQDKTALTKVKIHQSGAIPDTSYKPKQINDIQAQVNKGRKMINAVKLGFGLYRIVKEEQERKQAVADEERRRKEEAAKTEMRPPSDGDMSDDEDNDDDLRSMVIALPPSPPTSRARHSREPYLDVKEKSDRPDSGSSTASSQRWKKINSALTAANTLSATPTVHVTDTSQDLGDDFDRSSTPDQFTTQRRNIASAPSAHRRRYLSTAKSDMSYSSRSSRKARKSTRRPYSPLYSNINYNDTTDRTSIYRQLCALLWILEAMSQDQQPAVMPPITSCWKLKLLNEDPRFARKRAEKDKTTEKDWTLFKQDPNRFTQRASSRRGTRRISIHPNSLQRLTNTAVANSTSPRQSIPTLKIPDNAAPRSNVTSDESLSNQNQYKNHPDHASSVTFNEPAVNSSSTPPVEAQPPSSPKNRLSRQKSFTVTTVYNTNASRAMNNLRAKSRAAKAFKTSLSQKELDKLSQDEPPNRNESRVSAWVQATGAINAKRFTAAAIAAFGTITLDQNVDKVPIEMKSKFEEVAEEKALVLHDNLEVRDRSRLQILERKLMCLEMFNNMYKALDKMRSKSVVLDDETNEEMRQRVSEECRWYKDLIETLPEEIKDDLCCTLVLNKLASYGSLEGRKISSSQFVKVLSSLRVWEVCSPDVSAAIEFVREKVVEMTEEDYEDWFQVTFPQPKRAVSAPPPRTNGFRY